MLSLDQNDLAITFSHKSFTRIFATQNKIFLIKNLSFPILLFFHPFYPNPNFSFHHQIKAQFLLIFTLLFTFFFNLLLVYHLSRNKNLLLHYLCQIFHLIQTHKTLKKIMQSLKLLLVNLTLQVTLHLLRKTLYYL